MSWEREKINYNMADELKINETKIRNLANNFDDSSQNT